MTHDQNAREAMIAAIYRQLIREEDVADYIGELNEKGYVSVDAYLNLPHLVDAILAADVLRQKLGPRAIEAILAGEAAVVPTKQIADTQCFHLDARRGYISVAQIRLDTPSEPL